MSPKERDCSTTTYDLDHHTKTVRFAAAPLETHVFERKTDEDNRQAWYSSQDYDAFSADCRYIVQSAKEYSLDDQNYCTRGLERFIYSDGSASRKAAIQFILDEQEHQRELGMYDPMELMRTSLVASKTARTVATHLAAVDAIDASAPEYPSPLHMDDDDDWLVPEEVIGPCSWNSEPQEALQSYPFWRKGCGRALESENVQVRPQWLEMEE